MKASKRKKLIKFCHKFWLDTQSMEHLECSPCGESDRFSIARTNTDYCHTVRSLSDPLDHFKITGRIKAGFGIQKAFLAPDELFTDIRFAVHPASNWLCLEFFSRDPVHAGEYMSGYREGGVRIFFSTTRLFYTNRLKAVAKILA